MWLILNKIVSGEKGEKKDLSPQKALLWAEVFLFAFPGEGNETEV